MKYNPSYMNGFSLHINAILYRYLYAVILAIIPCGNIFAQTEEYDDRFTLDFTQIQSNTDRDYISGQDMLTSYMYGDRPMFSEIIDCDYLRYPFSSMTQKGLMFYCNTDKSAKLRFKLAPYLYSRPRRINFYIFPDWCYSQEDTPSRVKIGINDEEPIELEVVNPSTISSTSARPTYLTFETMDKIVKEISIEVVPPQGDIAEDLYYICLNKIVVIHDEPANLPSVTKWEFPIEEDTAYIADGNYNIPQLNTEPSEAAELAQYTSSAPEIALVRDNGTIKPQQAGITDITATIIPNNHLFNPDSTPSASLKLTVQNENVFTISPTVSTEYNQPIEIFDLFGRKIAIVNTLTSMSESESNSPISPGIYIIVTGNSTRKIVIK